MIVESSRVKVFLMEIFFLRKQKKKWQKNGPVHVLNIFSGLWKRKDEMRKNWTFRYSHSHVHHRRRRRRRKKKCIFLMQMTRKEGTGPQVWWWWTYILHDLLPEDEWWGWCIGIFFRKNCDIMAYLEGWGSPSFSCWPWCPPWVVQRQEQSSPRGRVTLRSHCPWTRTRNPTRRHPKCSRDSDDVEVADKAEDATSFPHQEYSVFSRKKNIIKRTK